MLTPEEKAAIVRMELELDDCVRMHWSGATVATPDLRLLLSALSRFTSPEWEAMEEAAKKRAWAYDHTTTAREYAEILRDTSGAIRALGRRLANAEGEG